MLAHLDIDRLRVVNRTHGYLIGDRVVRELWRRLQAVVTDGDVVQWLGGDEFLVLLCDVPDHAAARIATAALRSAVREPFQVDGTPIDVRLTVGAVFAPRDGSGEDLMSAAEIAMRDAKEEGGGQDRLVEATDLLPADGWGPREADLRRALERGELLVAFQPVVSLAARGSIGFEALVRWRHPGMGLLDPAAFIGLAEATGLIWEVGAFVLEEACRRLAAWQRDGRADVDVGVNLSPRQVTDERLPGLVADVVRRTGASPSGVTLEVTEAGLMQEAAMPEGHLRELRQTGVRVRLDDFGTGSSSLSFLRRFPIDGIKVDRSFVAGLAQSEQDREVLGAIVGLARGLGLELVTEGVETTDQAQWVTRLGCDRMQGYLFAIPLTGDELELLVTDGALIERRLDAIAEGGEPAPARAAAAGDGRLLTMGEAAQTLGVSPSTMRRWADSGALGAARTTGGHRRFPLSEVQRLKRAAAPVPAAVAPVDLRPEDLRGAAAALARHGAAIVATAGRRTYAAGRPGWFAAAEASGDLEHWAAELARALERGDLAAADDVTRDLLRRGRRAGSTLAERMTFLLACGDATMQVVGRAQDDRRQLVGARMLFRHLRSVILQDTPADV